MDLKVPITITDELSDEVISASGLLDLASGDIQRVEYTNYDVDTRGLPADSDDYEFTSGVLSHNNRDVEFRVDVNRLSGQYSVSASELLEIKVRAAQLFAGITGKALLAGVDSKEARAKGARPGKGGAAAAAAPAPVSSLPTTGNSPPWGKTRLH